MSGQFLQGRLAFSAEESLGLQKQPDGQQWTESSDEQRDFHPQG